MKKTDFLKSAVLLLGTIGGVASAQDVAPAPAAPDRPQNAASAGEEIIVTAQKREQRLHDVPVAVSVIGNKQLKDSQVNTLADLSRVTPSLENTGSPGNPDAHPSLRGLTTNGFSITAEQAVSTVLDGVVLGRTPLAGLVDVARVEVLRGPQGTLFGKNASAGVINVTTNAPNFDKFEAIGHADVGTKFGYRSLTGVVNLPVMSNLAVRVSAGDTAYSGILHNVLTGKDDKFESWGVRGRVLWQPTPDIKVNLIADYDHLSASEQSFEEFNRYQAPGTPLPTCPQIIPSENLFAVCNGDPTGNAQKDYGFSGQIEWDLGQAIFTSITSYRLYANKQTTDGDGLPEDVFHNGSDYNNNVFSQEARFSSAAGSRIEWVLGGYYSYTNVKNAYRQFGSAVGAATASNSGASQQTAAIFGQLTAHVTDKLSLIAGGRGTRDVTTLFSQSVTPAGARQNGDDRQKNFSWKLGAQYAFDRRFMAYFTATRGYKGTQVNFVNITSPTDPRGPVGATVTNAVIPEYPMAYELGVKKQLFGGRMDVNADLFHTRVKNYQGQVYDPLANNGQGGLINGNIPSVTSKGAEVDIFGRLAKGWTANLGAIYVLARYPKGYVTTCITDPGAFACPNNPGTGLVTTGGNQLPNAPKFKLTLTSTYEQPVSERLVAFLGGDAVYRTKQNFTNQPNPFTVLGSNVLLNFRLGVRSEDQRWSVAAFVRNATNYHIPSALTSSYLFANNSLPGAITSSASYGIDSRRMIGFTFDGRF